VLTNDGPVQLDVPRDRLENFQPILVPKHESRFTGWRRAWDRVIPFFALPHPSGG